MDSITKTGGETPGETTKPQSAAGSDANRSEAQELNELERAVLAMGPDGAGDFAFDTEDHEKDEPEETGETAETEPSEESDETEETGETEETEEEPEETEPEQDDAELEAKLSERAQKRINELTGRAKTAEEKAEALEKELAELRQQAEERATEPAPQAQASANPEIDAIHDPKELEKREETLFQLRDTLLLHPDGWDYTDPETGEVKEVTAEQVRRHLVLTQRTLERDIPRRKALLEQNRVLNQQAEEFFPELKDASSELRTRADAVARSLPAVKNLPGWRFATAYYALGHMLAETAGKDALKVLRELKAKPKAKAEAPAATRKPTAPKVAPTGHRPPKRAEAGLAAAKKRLLEAAAAGHPDHETEALEAMVFGGR